MFIIFVFFLILLVGHLELGMTVFLYFLIISYNLLEELMLENNNLQEG